MVIDGSKIDSSCPNSQFNIPGYGLYQNDRKKGGGGRIVLERSYNTIEPTVLDIQLKSRNMFIIGKY